MTTQEEYRLACLIYEVNTDIWSELHEDFATWIFCNGNKKSFISEYLFWEELVSRMKEENITYYKGIDTFLKVYKNAVYNCLNISLEE